MPEEGEPTSERAELSRQLQRRQAQLRLRARRPAQQQRGKDATNIYKAKPHERIIYDCETYAFNERRREENPVPDRLPDETPMLADDIAALKVARTAQCLAAWSHGGLASCRDGPNFAIANFSFFCLPCLSSSSSSDLSSDPDQA